MIADVRKLQPTMSSRPCTVQYSISFSRQILCRVLHEIVLGPLSKMWHQMRPLASGTDQLDSLQPGLKRQLLGIRLERTRRKVTCRLTYEVETLWTLRPGVTLRCETMEMQIVLQYLDAFALLTMAVSKVLATITDHSLCRPDMRNGMWSQRHRGEQVLRA